MHLSISWFSFLLVIARILMSDGLAYDEVLETFEQGMRNYSASIKPVLNQSDHISISVALYLMRISAVKENEQTLQTTGFLVVAWNDQIMQRAFRPLCKEKNVCQPLFPTDGVNTFEEEFELHYVQVSPSRLWLPDMRLHNAQSQFTFDTDDALLTLYYGGDVIWVPGGQFETHCDMDVRKFPFDKHSCHIDVGPWQSNKQRLTSDTKGVDLMYFEKGGEWQIRNTYLDNASYIIGGCCRYTIEIERRPEMLVATMILPTTLLSFIGTLVFKLPTESGERISLSVSIILALILYLTIIQNILPRSVTKPSYFEILLCSEVLLNIINVVMAVISINIYHRFGNTRLKRSSILFALLPKVCKEEILEYNRRRRKTDGVKGNSTIQESTDDNLKQGNGGENLREPFPIKSPTGDFIENGSSNRENRNSSQRIETGDCIENDSRDQKTGDIMANVSLETGDFIIVPSTAVATVVDKGMFMLAFTCNILVEVLFIIMVCS